MMEEDIVGAQSKSRPREDTQNWDRWVQAPIGDSWGDIVNSRSLGSWVRLNVVLRTRKLTMVVMGMTNKVSLDEKAPEEVTV